MKTVTFLFFIYVSSVSTANAVSLSLSFPGFNGTYFYPDATLSETFDFGAHFSSIQSAELTIEASGTAGLLQSCDMFTLQCTTSSFGPDLLWGFSREPGHNFVSGSQALTNSLTTYTFDITSESSFLLDGSGKLNIQPNYIYSIPSVSITILQPSSYQISNVTLKVEGTVVPIPSALLLFLSGLVSIVGLNKLKGDRQACQCARA